LSIGRHTQGRRHRARVPVVAAVTVLALGAAIAYVAMSTTAPRRSDNGRENRSQISARIRVPAPAFRIAAGAGSVWAISRAPDAAVVRIDPASNTVVGAPTPLPVDPWDLTVGGGSVWITPNGADGRLIRVSARTGRITGRLTARPVYFGSEVVFGHGHLWTGNDDERYKQGRTLTKVDPESGRVIGRPLVLGSAQSLAVGLGAVWDADHSGWLVKIDPASAGVVARRRLDFAPHGVVAARGTVYVADAHGGRLLAVDPATLDIRRSAKLAVPPIFPVAGGGSIWSGSADVWDGTGRDDRIARIDPDTLTIAETVRLGGPVSAVAFAFGSVWAALRTGEVVRVTPG